MGLALGAAVVAHAVIAAAFVGIALVVTPRIRFFAPRALGRLGRLGAAAFFLSSAFLHAVLAWEASVHGLASRSDPRGVGAWFDSWTGLATAGAEALAALVFLGVAAVYASPLVADPASIRAAVDERIREIAGEVERRDGDASP